MQRPPALLVFQTLKTGIGQISQLSKLPEQLRNFNFVTTLFKLTFFKSICLSPHQETTQGSEEPFLFSCCSSLVFSCSTVQNSPHALLPDLYPSIFQQTRRAGRAELDAPGWTRRAGRTVEPQTRGAPSRSSGAASHEKTLRGPFLVLRHALARRQEGFGLSGEEEKMFFRATEGLWKKTNPPVIFSSQFF